MIGYFCLTIVFFGGILYGSLMCTCGIVNDYWAVKYFGEFFYYYAIEGLTISELNNLMNESF